MKFKFSILLTFFLYLTVFTSAGQFVIKGRVTDAKNGDPIPFASVGLVGVSQGATTNFQGEFTLNSKYSADSLFASFVGYKKRVKKITRGAKLQEIDLKKLELENADRDSARKAHQAIATSPDAHILEKLTMPILALGTVALAFMLIGILLFINIPDSQENIIIFALGFITSAATQVLSFYFGSSQGSKEKDLKALKK